MTQARFPSLVGLRLRAFGAKPPSEQNSTHMLPTEIWNAEA